MASIKIKFRPSTVADHEGSVYYQIIHGRKVRQLLSHCNIYPSEWDEAHSRVKIDKLRTRTDHISEVQSKIRSDLERINRIMRKLEKDKLDFSADDIIEEYHRCINENTLFKYMEKIINRLRDGGKIRTAETYTAALRSIRLFLRDSDITLDTISPDMIEQYQTWLRLRGLAPNTISFYNRILRAVYNRAVDAGIIDNARPFHRVYTGIDKTPKRALPLRFISRIKNIDLAGHPKLEYARDMFLMSFMLRGMSFIDMAFLRKTDLRNGYITYRRRKTGRVLIIKWLGQMQAIIDKYPSNNTPFLLPIIRKTVSNERNSYRNAAYNINRHLKTIAALAGIDIPLTLYVARHSWASAAKAKGVPLAVISEGMGHDSEATTSIYLASLDTSVVDRANSKILASI